MANCNDSAFPTEEPVYTGYGQPEIRVTGGLTKREYIAIKMMPALINPRQSLGPEELANAAIKLADALLTRL